MSTDDNNLGTGTGNGVDGTSANSAEATQSGSQSNGNPTAESSTAATNDDQVTLSRSDYQNLISLRDKNHAAAQNAGNDVEHLTGAVNDLLKDKVIETVQKQYADVPREVLEVASSPEEMEAIAKATQAKIDEKVNAAQADLTKVGQPKLTDDEIKAQLKQLEGSGKLEEALDLKLKYGLK